MFPKSQAFMEKKIINHRKFYQTHGEDLCQIDISGGWAISEPICLQPSDPDVFKPPRRSPGIAARRPGLARVGGAGGLARFPHWRI
jgi:hypothetical protein